MRTVEEFIAIVEKENKKHNDELLSLSPATLIGRAWEIAKWQAIYDYIMERVIPYFEDEDEICVDFISLDIDNPIAEIFGYEFNYDKPQWATWDGLDGVLQDMIHEIKNQNN